MTLYKKGSKGEIVKQIQKLLHVYPDGIFGPITEEAVKDFQKANGLTVDGIVGPATLLKLGLSSFKKSSRWINEIIVHCSATPEGKDYTVEDITRWHKQRGFTTIGYHYVIYRDGSIHAGRDINISGAHCTNHNAHSIGICYIGGCAADGVTPKDTRTPEQKNALLNILIEMRMLYPKASIHGHRDFANKACPSFDATREYKDV